LSPAERRARSRAICAAIRKLSVFRRARRIGVFVAFDGEPDLSALMETASRNGQWVYAPVISGSQMRFTRVGPESMRANLFGILEPALGTEIDPRRLDLVLTPLVAFDDRGTRLGVGRGYYDRCFGFLRHRQAWQRPKLLGVAYELQRAPSLERQPWDIPLWGVVTEAGFHPFRANEGQ
jgi:5-formyltetrahydrofolate cyclo-ligase